MIGRPRNSEVSFLMLWEIVLVVLLVLIVLTQQKPKTQQIVQVFLATIDEIYYKLT